MSSQGQYIGAQSTQPTAHIGLLGLSGEGPRQQYSPSERPVAQDNDRLLTLLEADWKRIRRGWYLGEAGFKDRLLEQMGNLLGQGKAASVSGQAVRAWTEQEAEQWVQKALRVLGLDAAKLEALPKGAEAKLVMAWRLRGRTTTSRRWIAQRLSMGHETRVTLAVRTVSGTKRGRLGRLRERIAGITRDHS